MMMILHTIYFFGYLLQAKGNDNSDCQKRPSWSLRSQRSLPAGCDRCDRCDRRVVTVATAKQPAAYLPAGYL